MPQEILKSSLKSMKNNYYNIEMNYLQFPQFLSTTYATFNIGIINIAQKLPAKNFTNASI